MHAHVVFVHEYLLDYSKHVDFVHEFILDYRGRQTVFQNDFENKNHRH